MKFVKILALLILLIILFSKLNNVWAIYDPSTVSNNKFGIHILFPSELSEAAHLVNSSGGDWGYVTIPIQATDRNLIKWQAFMDDCKKYHLIPLIRIATIGDYFNKDAWSKPDDYDIIDFANFLNDLNWPTKNRYVIIFNEPNRGDEWGGSPDASEYAQILDYAATVFKERSDEFFIISAGLDNASANNPGQSIDEYTFMWDMEQADPGIFSKIDGLGSHSYPNPGFSMPPNYYREGIDSFYYQQQQAYYYSGTLLPVFITETGWTSNKISQEQQSQYYIQSFNNFWNDDKVIAVTPFVFNANQGPFQQFSFMNSDTKNKIYYALFNLPKTKGEPNLNPMATPSVTLENKIPTEKFNSVFLKSIFQKIGNQREAILKWLLGI